jgi:hypothetical protein
VAEDLALEERRRDRRAVERHELELPPSRELVQRLRDQLLAGPALADDENRQRARGNLLDLPEHRPHLLGLSPEPLERAALPELGLQAALLRFELASAAETREEDLELQRLDGLLEEVLRAEAHRLDRLLLRPLSREEDDRDVPGLLEPPYELEPVEPRHHEVREDCGRRVVLDLLEGLLGRGGGFHLMPQGLEQPAQPVPGAELVVHHQNVVAHGSPRRPGKDPRSVRVLV